MINADVNATPEKEEAPTLEGLVTELGGTSEPETEPEGTVEEPKEEAPKQEKEPKEEPKEEPALDVKPDPEDKKTQAFAQMRVENKKFQSVIKGIAEVLGVEDTSNPDTVMSALEKKILEDQSQKKGVPPEILQRLQELELSHQESVQDQIRQTAYLGFQKVKDTFNLSNQEVEKFALDLQKNGVNPFDKPMDIVREYKLLHFDSLLEKAKEEAVQSEMKRSTKASQQGSTPDKKTGQGDVGAEKITTVADLEKWMDSQSK